MPEDHDEIKNVKNPHRPYLVCKLAYDLISDEIKKFTPDKGFNLVGIDDFGMPGESLYLIEHFDTKDDAIVAQKKMNIKTAIYP